MLKIFFSSNLSCLRFFYTYNIILPDFDTNILSFLCVHITFLMLSSFLYLHYTFMFIFLLLFCGFWHDLNKYVPRFHLHIKNVVVQNGNEHLAKCWLYSVHQTLRSLSPGAIYAVWTWRFWAGLTQTYNIDEIPSVLHHVPFLSVWRPFRKTLSKGR